jgi:hypothetical protein
MVVTQLQKFIPGMPVMLLFLYLREDVTPLSISFSLSLSLNPYFPMKYYINNTSIAMPQTTK